MSFDPNGYADPSSFVSGKTVTPENKPAEEARSLETEVRSNVLPINPAQNEFMKLLEEAAATLAKKVPALDPSRKHVAGDPPTKRFFASPKEMFLADLAMSEADIDNLHKHLSTAGRNAYTHYARALRLAVDLRADIYLLEGM